MRRFGRQFLGNEYNALPPHVGVLRVGEVRDLSLQRQVVRAQLMDLRNEADVIPVLNDVRLLWAQDGKMRLTGLERVDSVDYAQTWSVEFI
jgi:hypothetical protein